MATNISDAKYQKLASEYSKLRAQASVLKKAVLDEQAKNSNIREQLRQRETSLRRSEQEVDSLGFRNKQLEHRVAALQEDIASYENKKRNEKADNRKISKESGASVQNTTSLAGNGSESFHDALIFEELQKKIMSNAQLTSLNDDKDRELTLCADRIANLEQTLAKRAMEHSELEKRLRRDIDLLQSKNTDLETKLVEAASILGSEDALSASGSDNTPLHTTNLNHILSAHGAIGATAIANTNTSEFERIAFLEKEVSHWRSQYEISKLNEAFSYNNKEKKSQDAIQTDDNCCCSSAAAGLTIVPSYSESKSAQRAREQRKEPLAPPSKEQLLHNNFSKKFEDLLRAKCVAESHVASYVLECEHLQSCLEEASEEVKAKEEDIQSMNHALQRLEDDLATTRVNYEEQISVLTEQVISLSEQLAACK